MRKTSPPSRKTGYWGEQLRRDGFKPNLVLGEDILARPTGRGELETYRLISTGREHTPVYAYAGTYPERIDS